MALAAAIALAFHVRLSRSDRRSVALSERAIALRHLALYALVVVGLLFATFSATQALSDVWRRIADALVPLSGVDRPVPPSGFTPPPQR